MATKMVFTLVAVLVSLSILYQPSEAIRQGPDWIIGIHNAYRRLVGIREGFTVGNMKKMHWDSKLAREAASFAMRDRLNDLPEPEYSNMGIPIRGINLAVGKGHMNVLRLIHSWYEERKYYDRKYNDCYPGKRCHNYMQLVSAETDRVGCALRKPSPGVTRRGVSVFICVYAPGLNTADPIYRVGDRCSLCTRPSAFCKQGLCSDCRPHSKDTCECRKTCQTNNGYGVLSKHTCTCHCIYGHGPNCNDQCRNPEMYLNFDICGEVTEIDCRSDDLEVRAMLEEFCPEQCSCRAMPSRD